MRTTSQRKGPAGRPYRRRTRPGDKARAQKIARDRQKAASYIVTLWAMVRRRNDAIRQLLHQQAEMARVIQQLLGRQAEMAHVCDEWRRLRGVSTKFRRNW